MLFTWVINGDNGPTYFRTAVVLTVGATLELYMNGTSFGYYNVDSVNLDGDIVTVTAVISAGAGALIPGVTV